MRNSITRSAIIYMVVSAVVLLVALSILAYWYVVRSRTAEEISMLEHFVTQRVAQEQKLFSLARDNLNFLTDEFLRQYQSAMLNSETEVNTVFEELFHKDEKSAYRTKEAIHSDYLDASGRLYHGVSGFIGNNQSVADVDFRRRMILAVRIAAQFGPALQTRFVNTHFTFPENAIVRYWPEVPWGLQARADLPMNELGTIAAMLQQKNPERVAQWTALYFDSTASEWTITYEKPVDFNGRHLVNPSHDVLLTELMDRLIDTTYGSGYNFVLNHNGDLIAHPAPITEDQRWIAQLEHSTIKDPVILDIYAAIKAAGQPDAEKPHTVQLKNHGLYASYQPFGGPDWYFISVIDESSIISSARSVAGAVLTMGLYVALLLGAIAGMVIRRTVGKPLGLMVRAAEAIGEGRYDDVVSGRIPIPTDQDNEMGLFARQFAHMAEQIRDASRNLEAVVEERTRELQRANESLRQLGLLDGLTGIHNRRSFDRDLTNILDSIKTADKDSAQAALILIDVDWFKTFNDTYGHAEGDRALRTVARTLENTARQDDRAYRYGGEEFAILTPNTGSEGATRLVDRVLNEIRSHNILHKGSPFGILTVSAGFAVFQSGDNAEEVIRRADQKLYAAKKAGRNRGQG